MNFPLQNKRQKRARIHTVLVLLATGALFLFGLNIVFDGVIAQVVRTPATALLSIRTTLENVAAEGREVVTPKQALINERDALKARIRELEIYALNNLVLSAENAELRELLGGRASSGSGGVLGHILSRGGVLPYGTLLVETEAASSPAVGTRAYAESSIVVGHVTESEGRVTTVRLLSAAGEVHEVLVGVEDRMFAAKLQGIGNGNMIIEVARAAEVEVGDPVILAGAPSAIVGYVGDIATTPTSALKTVRVRTPVNVHTLRFMHFR